MLTIFITNAVIIDYSGIIKADIGIKDGLIVSIGKAGNPDTMDGVFPNMIIGVNPISQCSSRMYIYMQCQGHMLIRLSLLYN